MIHGAMVLPPFSVAPSNPGLSNRANSVCACVRFGCGRWAANKRNGEQAARKEFAALDEDGSGSLDKDELAELCVRMGKALAPAEVDALMAELDVDGSGGTRGDRRTDAQTLRSPSQRARSR